MRKFLITLTIVLVLTGATLAQSVQVTGAGYDDHDRVKITAAFQNLNVANQNLPGANLSLDYRLGSFGRWRLGGVVDGAYQYDTNKNLDRYQFLGGPQLGFAVSERLYVFGRGLFGGTRFDNRRVGSDFTRLTVGFGGGVDVHYGSFFIRPIQIDAQYIDERPVRYTRLAAGGGFRF